MPTHETQEQIDAHNLRSLWQEARDSLQCACEEIERAQGLIEDAGALHISENLKPLAESVKRFEALAGEKMLDV